MGARWRALGRVSPAETQHLAAEQITVRYCGEVVPSRRMLAYQIFYLTIYQTQLQYGQTIKRLVSMFPVPKRVAAVSASTPATLPSLPRPQPI